jgi:hypothetical protein
MMALLFRGIRARRRDGREPFQQSIHDLTGLQQMANRPQGRGGWLGCCRRLPLGVLMGKIRPGGRNK